MKQLLLFVSLFFAFLPLINTGCSGVPSKAPEAAETIVFPEPPAIPRIQYLTSFSASGDVIQPKGKFHRFVFGEETSLPIIKPYGITVHGKRVYICDTGLGGIEVLDLEQGSFEYFIPKGLGKLLLPLNCALDEMGFLYVADGNRKQVVIFDENSKFIHAITLENEFKPTDVEVNDSLIFIAAIDDHSIHVYDKSTRAFIRKIPAQNEADPKLLFQAANICLHDSLLLVSDLGGCKVSVFDLFGSAKGTFGKPGRGYGEFTRPKGIAADNEGNIYVVDAAFENVQVFNDKGDLLMNFGGTYEGPGGMWLPAGVTLDYGNLDYFKSFVNDMFQLEYLVFVTNQYGPDRVSVYGFISTSE